MNRIAKAAALTVVAGAAVLGSAAAASAHDHGRPQQGGQGHHNAHAANDGQGGVCGTGGDLLGFVNGNPGNNCA
ncbi:chaplin [Streptomyces sp. NBC_01262]|uniref:chaplin n=1 Tax=Streptomyces sp. NBC_01262 TaxID=2903803 RepID=UPI002E349209|nr:chaplin [Streptomyces sp. NBC_01262]